MEPTSPGDVRGASTGPPSGPPVEMPGEVVVDGGTVLTVDAPTDGRGRAGGTGRSSPGRVLFDPRGGCQVVSGIFPESFGGMT